MLTGFVDVVGIVGEEHAHHRHQRYYLDYQLAVRRDHAVHALEIAVSCQIPLHIDGAQLVQGRADYPLRVVAEFFGHSVTYHGVHRRRAVHMHLYAGAYVQARLTMCPYGHSRRVAEQHGEDYPFQYLASLSGQFRPLFCREYPPVLFSGSYLVFSVGFYTVLTGRRYSPPVNSFLMSGSIRSMSAAPKVIKTSKLLFFIRFSKSFRSQYVFSLLFTASSIV